MARTSNFANVATVTRASTKTDAGGWDFTNGGTVGTLTEYASGVAAIHSTAGLLVEESTTNEIRNPRCEGAVAGTIGSGGALPTHWTSGLGSNVTVIHGIGYEDGSPYIEIEVTTTGAANPQIYFEGLSQISASSGDTVTISFGLKEISSTVSVNAIFRARETDGASVIANTPGISVTPDTTHKRYFDDITLVGGGSVTNVVPGVVLQFAGAGSYRFRIYAPQHEDKAYPTGPVFPTVSSPAASTRATDSLSIPNGAWEKASSGFSAYVALTTLGSSDGAVLALGPTNNDRSTIECDGTIFTNSSGVSIFNSGYTGDTSAGVTIKAAVAMADNNFAASRSTVSQLTSSTGLATQYGNGVKMNGAPGGGAAIVQGAYVTDLRYWPKRLTNAELEALVGN